MEDTPQNTPEPKAYDHTDFTGVDANRLGGHYAIKLLLIILKWNLNAPIYVKIL